MRTGLGSVQVLGDGRILVTGSQRYCMGCFSQIVARYTPDGTPDASFGKGGARSLLGTDDYGDGSYGTGLLVRRDGGLVLGYDRGPGPRIALVAPNGDAPPLETATAEPYVPRAELPGGRIVAQDTGGKRLLLLGPDMTPDPSFGGKAGVPMPFGRRSLLDVAATPNAVLVAGASGGTLILVRYRLDGSRAATMRVRLPRPKAGSRWASSYGDGLLIANGRAVIVSTVERTERRVTTSRTAVAAFSLRTNRVVTTFGKGGVAFAAQRYMQGALQQDGRVVLVAQSDKQPGDLVIRRLDATGRSDPSFRLRTVTTGLNQHYGMDVALDPAGRLLVASGAFTEYPSTGVQFIAFLTR